MTTGGDDPPHVEYHLLDLDFAPRIFWTRTRPCGYCSDVHDATGRGCASPIRHVPASELTPERRRARRVLS